MELRIVSGNSEHMHKVSPQDELWLEWEGKATCGCCSPDNECSRRIKIHDLHGIGNPQEYMSKKGKELYELQVTALKARVKDLEEKYDKRDSQYLSLLTSVRTMKESLKEIKT